MKELLLGNAAVARGLYEGGLRFVSSYPGTPSTEITERLAKYDEVQSEWAPNEKVALEAAFGASLAGARSACAMKHVGLNVAADPLFTLSYTGVNGGLVVCVADDPAMHSSQNEQDSRNYAIAAKLPMLEPSDSEECLAFAKAALSLSEDFDAPFLLRLVTRVSHSRSVAETSPRVETDQKPYVKNAGKYVMMPANARRRRPLVEERMQRLETFAETCPFNRVENPGKEIGVITSGAAYQYVKEVFGESVSVFKLGLVHPLPKKALLSFAKSVKKLYVIEELDPVIETHCRALGLSPVGKELFSPIGEFSQETVREAFGLPAPAFAEAGDLPARPPMMCAGCPHRGVFYALAKKKLTVLGDIGCYTLGAAPPLSAMDSTLCMGASVSGLHGFLKVSGPETAKKSVAVIGDSTFLHSGITGLTNAAYNASDATVIVLDNSITGMTGHQPNPATGYNIKGDPAVKVDLEALCKAVGIERVRVVDPYDLKAVETALTEELASPAPSVIIARRPCALLKNVRHKPPLFVDPDLCRACRKCMGLGCPALSIKTGKAKVDGTLCVGCGVCRSLCPFGAISEGGGRDA